MRNQRGQGRIRTNGINVKIADEIQEILAATMERRGCTKVAIVERGIRLDRDNPPTSFDAEREANRTELCALLEYPTGVGQRDLYAGSVAKIESLQQMVAVLRKA